MAGERQDRNGGPTAEPGKGEGEPDATIQADAFPLGATDTPEGLVAVHRRAATRLLREGEAQKAFAELVRASRSVPMDAGLAGAMTATALRAGTEYAAVTLLLSGLEDADGAHRIAVRRQLARLLRRTGALDRAREQMVTVLAEKPGDRRARRVLNALLLQEERWEELDASLEKETKEALKGRRLRSAAQATLRRARVWADRLDNAAHAAVRYGQAAQYLEQAEELDGAYEARKLWLRALLSANAPRGVLDDALKATLQAADHVGDLSAARALARELGLHPEPETFAAPGEKPAHLPRPRPIEAAVTREMPAVRPEDLAAFSAGSSSSREKSETALSQPGGEATGRRATGGDHAPLSSRAAQAEPGKSPEGTTKPPLEAGAFRKLEAQLVARGRWRELATLYSERANAPGTAPAEQAELLGRLAEVLEDELGDLNSAARAYADLARVTGDKRALDEQVRLLHRLESVSGVKRALDDAVEGATDDASRANALVTRGEAALIREEYANARKDFEAALGLDAASFAARAGIAEAAAALGDLQPVESLREALIAMPRRERGRTELFRRLARIAERHVPDLQLARVAWSEVLADVSIDPEAQDRLAGIARKLDDVGSLEPVLRAKIRRDPRAADAKSLRLELVTVLERAGRNADAMDELMQAVRFDPGHQEAWLRLADRYVEQPDNGRAAWALEHAATATEDESERAALWERLAHHCRERIGDPNRAQIYASRAAGLRASAPQKGDPRALGATAGFTSSPLLSALPRAVANTRPLSWENSDPGFVPPSPPVKEGSAEARQETRIGAMPQAPAKRSPQQPARPKAGDGAVVPREPKGETRIGAQPLPPVKTPTVEPKGESAVAAPVPSAAENVERAGEVAGIPAATHAASTAEVAEAPESSATKKLESAGGRTDVPASSSAKSAEPASGLAEVPASSEAKNGESAGGVADVLASSEAKNSESAGGVAEVPRPSAVKKLEPAAGGAEVRASSAAQPVEPAGEIAAVPVSATEPVAPADPVTDARSSSADEPTGPSSDESASAPWAAADRMAPGRIGEGRAGAAAPADERAGGFTAQAEPTGGELEAGQRSPDLGDTKAAMGASGVRRALSGRLAESPPAIGLAPTERFSVARGLPAGWKPARATTTDELPAVTMSAEPAEVLKEPFPWSSGASVSGEEVQPSASALPGVSSDAPGRSSEADAKRPGVPSPQRSVPVASASSEATPVAPGAEGALDRAPADTTRSGTADESSPALPSEASWFAPSAADEVAPGSLEVDAHDAAAALGRLTGTDVSTVAASVASALDPSELSPASATPRLSLETAETVAEAAECPPSLAAEADALKPNFTFAADATERAPHVVGVESGVVPGASMVMGPEALAPHESAVPKPAGPFAAITAATLTLPTLSGHPEPKRTGQEPRGGPALPSVPTITPATLQVRPLTPAQRAALAPSIGSSAPTLQIPSMRASELIARQPPPPTTPEPSLEVEGPFDSELPSLPAPPSSTLRSGSMREPTRTTAEVPVVIPPDARKDTREARIVIPAAARRTTPPDSPSTEVEFPFAVAGDLLSSSAPAQPALRDAIDDSGRPSTPFGVTGFPPEEPTSPSVPLATAPNEAFSAATTLAIPAAEVAAALEEATRRRPSLKPTGFASKEIRDRVTPAAGIPAATPEPDGAREDAPRSPASGDLILERLSGAIERYEAAAGAAQRGPRTEEFELPQPQAQPVPGSSQDEQRAELFAQVRDNPLDADAYHLLADHFDHLGDVERGDLMAEIATALEAVPEAPARVPRLILSARDRAGLRHPFLRTEAGELLSLCGTALCQLFPSTGRAAGSKELFHLETGPGAQAAADAVLAGVRILGLRAPDLYLAEDSGPPFSLSFPRSVRLLVGRAAVRKAMPAPELRFFAGRALFTQSPDLLALRNLSLEELEFGIETLGVALFGGKRVSDEAWILRESISAKVVHRLQELYERVRGNLALDSLAEGARHSANRAGLVVAGAVAPALSALRAKKALDAEIAELVRFAASERYLNLRARRIPG